MTEPDYRADEETLFQATLLALKEFAETHPHEMFCSFAFDCNSDYGEVLLCLDTVEQSRQAARQSEGRAFERRQKYGSDYDVLPQLLTMARGTVCNNDVLPFGDNTGDFAYQGFAEVTFEAWADFTLDDEYPALPDGEEGDYLQCKAAILLGRVIDRLVAANAFDGLQRTMPFLVGVGFHDGGQYVVRVLWE